MNAVFRRTCPPPQIRKVSVGQPLWGRVGWGVVATFDRGFRQSSTAQIPAKIYSKTPNYDRAYYSSCSLKRSCAPGGWATKTYVILVHSRLLNALTFFVHIRKKKTRKDLSLAHRPFLRLSLVFKAQTQIGTSLVRLKGTNRRPKPLAYIFTAIWAVPLLRAGRPARPGLRRLWPRALTVRRSSDHPAGHPGLELRAHGRRSADGCRGRLPRRRRPVK
jgi:hypothetical protein